MSTYTRYVESIERGLEAPKCRVCGADLPEEPVESHREDDCIGNRLVGTACVSVYVCEKCRNKTVAVE